MNGHDRLQALRLRNDLKGEEMEAMRPRFERMRTRHEDGTAPRAVSAFQLFQTPQVLASRLVTLSGMLPGDSVLEPSAGLGRLLVATLKCNPEPSRLVAVEVDKELAGELYRGFESIELRQADFLSLEDLGTFDRIVMNPPFHMRADVRHVRHALKFLRPGGTLAGLCLSGPHRERDIRPLCDHWEVIPAGAFSHEGTKVETILFRIRK